MDVREELLGLTALEEEILVALALVGSAELSRDELAALAGAEHVGAAVDELVRRGLVGVERDGSVGGRSLPRRILAASDRAHTVLERAVGFAETGRLSPETLLGLSAWALRAGRYPEALAILRGAETGLAVARQAEEWSELLSRAEAVARERAGEVRRPVATVRPEGALARRVLTGAAVAATGVAGLVLGLVVVDEPQAAQPDPAVTTVTERSTVVETVAETTTVAVTEPGPVETVTVTEPGPVETVTETVTTTVTVPPPPPPPITID